MNQLKEPESYYSFRRRTFKIRRAMDYDKLIKSKKYYVDPAKTIHASIKLRKRLEKDFHSPRKIEKNSINLHQVLRYKDLKVNTDELKREFKVKLNL